MAKIYGRESAAKRNKGKVYKAGTGFINREKEEKETKPFSSSADIYEKQHIKQLENTVNKLNKSTVKDDKWQAKHANAVKTLETAKKREEEKKNNPYTSKVNKKIKAVENNASSIFDVSIKNTEKKVKEADEDALSAIFELDRQRKADMGAINSRIYGSDASAYNLEDINKQMETMHKNEQENMAKVESKNNTAMAASARLSDLRLNKKEYADKNKTEVYTNSAKEDKNFANDANSGEKLFEAEKVKNITTDKGMLLTGLNEKEKRIYSYYLTKDKELANDYLDSIADAVNTRAAKITYNAYKDKSAEVDKKIEDIDNEYVKFLAKNSKAAAEDIGEGTVSFMSGYQKAGQGFRDFGNMITGNGKTTNENAVQKVQQLIRQDQTGVEAVINDILYSTGNMLPAMLVSVATGGAGAPALATSIASAATTFASSSGNSYADAVKAGQDVSDAVTYGVISGASEALLQYGLSGINKLAGGKITGALKGKLNNVIVKVAKSKAAKTALTALADNFADAGGEALEEYLQTVLEPVFRDMVFGETNKREPFSEEALYSAMLGAFSSAAINTATGDSVRPISNAIKESRATTLAVGEGIKASGIPTIQNLVKLNAETGGRVSKNSLGGKIDAKLKNGEEVSANEIGRLAKAVNKNLAKMEAEQFNTPLWDNLLGKDAMQAIKELSYESDFGAVSAALDGMATTDIATDFAKIVDSFAEENGINTRLTEKMAENGSQSLPQEYTQQLENVAQTERAGDNISEDTAKMQQKKGYYLLGDEYNNTDAKFNEIRNKFENGEITQEEAIKLYEEAKNEENSRPQRWNGNVDINEVRSVQMRTGQHIQGRPGEDEEGTGISKIAEGGANQDTDEEVLKLKEIAHDRYGTQCAPIPRQNLDKNKNREIDLFERLGIRLVYSDSRIDKLGAAKYVEPKDSTDMGTVFAYIGASENELIHELGHDEIARFYEKARDLLTKIKAIVGKGNYVTAIQEIRSEYLKTALEYQKVCDYYFGEGVNTEELIENELFCDIRANLNREGAPTVAAINGNAEVRAAVDAYSKEITKLKALQAKEIIERGGYEQGFGVGGYYTIEDFGEKSEKTTTQKGIVSMPDQTKKERNTKNANKTGLTAEDYVDPNTGKMYPESKRPLVKLADGKILHAGDTVKNLDRGNFGTLRDYDEETGEFTVRFKNKKTKKRVDIKLTADKFEKVTKAPQIPMPTDADAPGADTYAQEEYTVYDNDEHGRYKEEELSPRAKRLLDKRVNEFAKYIFKEFSTDSSVKADVKYQVKDLARRVLRGEEISPTLVLNTFNKVWESGIVTVREGSERGNEIRKHIKSYKIKVTKEIRDEVRNYGHLEANVDSLKTNLKEGTDVDVVYQELNELYPDVFPNDIINPTDRLARIARAYYVLKPKKSQVRLAQRAADERTFAFDAFKEKVKELTKEVKAVRRFMDGAFAQTGRKGVVSRNEVDSAYIDVKEARAAKDRYEKENTLSDKEKQIAENYAKGDDSPRGGNREKVISGYADILKSVYEAEATIEAYNKQAAAERYELARYVTEDSDLLKDKKNGLAYALDTIERNIEKIAGEKGKEFVKRFKEAYLDPMEANEAAANRFVNEMRRIVKDLALTNAESVLVQAYGEKLINDAQLAEIAENPRHIVIKDSEGNIVYDKKYRGKMPEVNADKVKTAAATFRGIYDMLLERANDTLVRNGYAPIEGLKDYFPHFSTHDGFFLSIVKFMRSEDKTTDSLPEAIAGDTEKFRPGKKFFANFLRRKGTATDIDAVKGFEIYLGNIKDVIFHTDDIRKIRALEDVLREKHTDEQTKKEIEDLRKSDLPYAEREERIKKALKNAGEGNLKNFIVWLSDYADMISGKKSKLDRPIERYLNRNIYLAATRLEGRVASNMVGGNVGSWLTNFLPIVQGPAQMKAKHLVPALGDVIKNWKHNDGFVNASDFLVNRRAKNGNLLSRTAADKYSDAMVKPMEIIDMFVTEWLTRAEYRAQIDKGRSHEEAMKNAGNKVGRIVADRAYGKLPTIFNAKNPLLKLFTVFQIEGNNLYRNLTHDMAMYAREDAETEVDEKISQSSGEISKNTESKRAAAIRRIIIRNMALGWLKYMIGAWLFNEIYERITGRRPAFDPIGMIADAVEAHEEEGPEAMALSVLEDVLENTPFIGGFLGGGRVPIRSAFPWDGSLEDAVNGISALFDPDVAGDKKWREFGKEMMKPVYYLVPPSGGGQIKKGVEAIEALVQGADYTYSKDGAKRAKFAMDSDAATVAKAAIFGKWATKGARQYLGEQDALSRLVTKGFGYIKENGLKWDEPFELDKDSDSRKKGMLSESGTEIFDYLKENELTPSEAFDFATQMSEVTGEKDKNGKTIPGSKAANYMTEIDESGFTENARYKLYEHYVFSDKTKAVMDEALTKGISKSKLMSLYSKIHNAAPELDENGEKIEGSKKKEIIAAIDAGGLNEQGKYFLYENYVLSDSVAEEFAEAQKAGISKTQLMDIYSETYDMGGYYIGEDAVANTKSLRIKDVIDEHIKTTKQREIAYSVFGVGAKVAAGNVTWSDVDISGATLKGTEGEEISLEEETQHNMLSGGETGDTIKRIGNMGLSTDEKYNKYEEYLFSDSASEKYAEAQDLGLTKKQIMDIYANTYDIGSYYENGKAVSNTKSLQLKDVIDEHVADEDKRAVAYAAFGVGKKVARGEVTWDDVDISNATLEKGETEDTSLADEIKELFGIETSGSGSGKSSGTKKNKTSSSKMVDTSIFDVSKGSKYKPEAIKASKYLKAFNTKSAKQNTISIEDVVKAMLNNPFYTAEMKKNARKLAKK